MQAAQVQQRMTQLLPDNPEEQLRGFLALWDNPYFLSLVGDLDRELDSSTAHAYDILETNEHFREVGRGLGLVRLRQLVEGRIKDLSSVVRERDDNVIEHNRQQQQQ